MNFIKEMIWAIRSGRYSGKGDKYTRKGDFQKALYYYEKALKYSSENSGSCVIFTECISRSHARLKDYDKALSEAEKCLQMLISIDSSAKPFIDAKNRIEYFIKAIKSNDSNVINKVLAI